MIPRALCRPAGLVMEPVIAKMGYLALCYSDFLSSENIPAGQDPGGAAALG